MDTRDPRVASLFAAARRIVALEREVGDGDHLDDEAVTGLARAVHDAAEVLPGPEGVSLSEAPVLPNPGTTLASELFRVSVEQAADAVFWLNAQGGFDYVNVQACAMLGYTREELLGLKLWDIDPGMTPKRFVLHWRSYDAPGAALRRFEASHRRKDGAIIPVEVSSRHLRVDGEAFHVAFTRDISARKRADAALRLTQFCIDKAALAVFRIDRSGRIVSANDQACRSLGYTREELLSLRVFDIGRRPEETWDDFFALVRSRGSMTFEGGQRRKDGTEYPIEITVNHIDAGGEEYIFSFTRDITAQRAAERERVSLQAQLAQAQKMESIGRLAGGIAHDFNNMLAIILGYTELLRSELPEGGQARADVAEIEHAAARSRDITRQLLAFSRKQVVTPRPVDLGAVIDNAQRTLLRLIGEDVDLTVRRDGAPTIVEMDPGQIDQILMNLVVNARDATTSGGRIAITTSCVELGEDECRRCVDFEPGRYACLEVADTGQGIDAAVMQHIFEPFFTTKGVGEGTGLGLATVYGIAKQNGGFVDVSSVPGEGATFRVYLPLRSAGAGAGRELSEGPLTGRGTILLVEDDAGVRQLTQRMLVQLGFTVSSVGDPAEALETLGAAMPDMLLTDVVMPGMGGAELCLRVRDHIPDLPVLFMSGYPAIPLSPDGGVLEGASFIQKPFDLTQLSRAVRSVMGAARVSRSA